VSFQYGWVTNLSCSLAAVGLWSRSGGECSS